LRAWFFPYYLGETRNLRSQQAVSRSGSRAFRLCSPSTISRIASRHIVSMATIEQRPALEQRVSRRMREMPPSGIRRFFEIAATMEDVISLGIGEPDFVSPRPIIDAVIESLNGGKTGYTANAGLLELRELVAAELQRLYGVQYDPRREIL